MLTQRCTVTKNAMQTNSTPEEAIWGDFLVFSLCAALGLRLIWLGSTNQILDSSGLEQAPRWMFIGGGILLQSPLIGFAIFLFHQGFFSDEPFASQRLSAFALNKS